MTRHSEWQAKAFQQWYRDNVQDIDKVLKNKAAYVKTFTIGHRSIAQPLDIYRRLLDNVQHLLKPLGPTGNYLRVVKETFRHHAVQSTSLQTKLLIHVDIKNAFNAIPELLVSNNRRLTQRLGLLPEQSRHLAQFLTYQHTLPQGFPTSSTVAHLVFQELIDKKKGILFTQLNNFLYTLHTPDYAEYLSDHGDQGFFEVIKKGADVKTGRIWRLGGAYFRWVDGIYAYIYNAPRLARKHSWTLGRIMEKWLETCGFQPNRRKTRVGWEDHNDSIMNIKVLTPTIGVSKKHLKLIEWRRRKAQQQGLTARARGLKAHIRNVLG